LAKSFVKADSLRLNVQAQITPKQRSACVRIYVNETVQIHLIDKSTNDWPLATASKLLNLLLWQPVSGVACNNC